MKKRLFCTLLCLSLSSFTFAGCGSTAQTDEPETTETTVAVEQETTTEVETEPEVTETVENTEAETQNENTEAVETTAEETTEEETTSEESSAYTFTDVDATMYAKSSVNVRSLPDTSGDRLGGLSTNDEVHVTGQCNETGWYRIDYSGSTAYVSNSYIVSEKVAVETPAESSSNSNSDNGGSSSNSGQNTSKSTPESDGYSEGVWYDMGEYAFKVCSPEETATKTFDLDDMSWSDKKGVMCGIYIADGRMVKIACPLSYKNTATVYSKWK